MGTGQIDCPCCGKAKVECDECDKGNVQTNEIDNRPGWIGNLLIDRQLMAMLLPHLAGECSVSELRWDGDKFTNEQNALLLVGDKWRVILMGMVPDRMDDADASSRFTAFKSVANAQTIAAKTDH